MPANSLKRDVALAGAAIAGLLLIHALVPSTAFSDFLVRCAAMGIFATSLNLLVGQTGMVSFGHGMFYGLGAYAFVLLMHRTTLDVISAFVLSLLIVGLIAAAVGAICVKLKENYFAFCTLAAQMFVYATIHGAITITGGDQGVGGIPRRSVGSFDLSNHANLYVVASFALVICLLQLRMISVSSFGVALRMIRDNERRATFIGLPVLRIKLAAFVISAMIAAVGGVLMSLFISGAYPELANWSTSGQAIFAIVLGGVNSFFGPLVGSIMLALLNDVVTRLTSYYGFVLGLVILLFVLGFRAGVLDFLPRTLFGRRMARVAAKVS